jgi:hypothetical protein
MAITALQMQYALRQQNRCILNRFLHPVVKAAGWQSFDRQFEPYIHALVAAPLSRRRALCVA